MPSGYSALLMLWLVLEPNSSGRPWEYLLLSLVCAAVFLISSRQDVGLGAKTGAVFGQVMAFVVLVGMTLKALASHWWIEAVIAATAILAELVLAKHWWLRRDRKRIAAKNSF